MRSQGGDAASQPQLGAGQPGSLPSVAARAEGTPLRELAERESPKPRHVPRGEPIARRDCWVWASSVGAEKLNWNQDTKWTREQALL